MLQPRTLAPEISLLNLPTCMLASVILNDVKGAVSVGRVARRYSEEEAVATPSSGRRSVCGGI